ncbi:MAG: CsiV family protein [Gammaproteobacteria bacterium]|nr:CsiV family protein [Gammaproteobacteria bacterium]
MTYTRVPITAAAILLLTTSPVHAREEIKDFLKNDWYEIEFFVFERSEVMDYDTTEALTLHTPHKLALNLKAQRPGVEGFESYYELDQETKLCLVFPTLEYSVSTTATTHFEYAEMRLLDVLDTQAVNSAAAQAVLEGGPAPEIFPLLEPHPLLDVMAQAARFESAMQERRDRWLPADTHVLDREANIVQNRGIGRILHHGRWLQAVPSREAPQPILIQGGERLANSWEIEGTVATTLGRYLHFQATLFYHAPGLGLEPIEFILRADGSITSPPTRQLDPFGYMLLDESRRMRSEEIHYLDHPKLGIVVRIDPVEMPTALLDAFEHLGEEEPENLGD